MNHLELKLLRDAKASNGGGVRDRRYPTPVVSAMLAKGYIEAKKGSAPLKEDGAWLMVITREGRSALALFDEDPLEAEAKKGPPGATVYLGD